MRIRLLVLSLVLGSMLSLFGVMREQRTIATTKVQLEQTEFAARSENGPPRDDLQPRLPSAEAQSAAQVQDALTKLTAIGKATGLSRFRLSDEGRAGDAREPRVTIEALGTYFQIKDFLAAALNDEIRLAPVDVAIRRSEAGQISLRMVVAVQPRNPK